MVDYPDREVISQGGVYYYGSSRTIGNCFNIGFTLAEDIDLEKLKEATRISLLRYPYFAVRLDSTEKDFVLIHNREDVPVSTKLATEWGKETNEYLWQIYVDGRDIYFYCFHGLSDGGGMLFFARTVFCNYFLLVHPELDSSIISEFMNGDVCTEDEWIDPYPEEPYADAGSFRSYDIENIYQIPGDVIPDREPGIGYYMKFDETEFVTLAKSVGGNPNLFVTMLMAKTLDEIRERDGTKDEKIMISGIAAQIKKFLGYPNTHYSVLPNILIPISNEDLLKSDSDLLNDFKEKRDDFLSEESLKAYVNGSIKLRTFIDSKNTVKEKQEMCQNVVKNSLGVCTFFVSYMRPPSFGEFSKYFESMQNHIGVHRIPWMMEMATTNGIFTMKSLQGIHNDDLIKGFCKQLDSYGIKYEISKEFPVVSIGWGY